MRNYNENRVQYFGRNDLAAGYYRDRCLELLRDSEKRQIESINDAIEAYQCKLTVEGIPELFEKEHSVNTSQASRQLFAHACAYVSTALSHDGIASMYDQVELQYREPFWQLIDACCAHKVINPADFTELLKAHPECIVSALERRRFVVGFDSEIADAMRKNPILSAETIINRLASDSTHDTKLFLPSRLHNADIDSIMLSYINDERANPNYLWVLRNWPSRTVSRYVPSAEIRVGAKRKHEESIQGMFENGAGLRYGAGVSIDMSQVACKGMTYEDLVITHSFSGLWLKKFTDPATIMNNLIYIFDYLDSNGLMTMPARKHESHGIMGLLGLHAVGEYRSFPGSHIRDSLALLETAAYSDFLEKHNSRLETALEWVYNEYFADEFGIEGFSLALPTKETTWLDKCKAIGPEIERAIKAYSIYAKRGEIDSDYFPFESMKTFSSVPALVKPKYVIAGPGFDQRGLTLFSDQCMLSHLAKQSESESCFYDVMLRHDITQNDYPEYLHSNINQLENDGFIARESKGLKPSPASACLKCVWDNDALALRFLKTAELKLVQELVCRNILTYCDTLFTPTEAAYLDYMFNDASFPNSLALRNRYDHAHAPIVDPNAKEIRSDYYRMLCLLICITLKINEELMIATGKGGLDNLVEWPLYDESVFSLAEELTREKIH
ncbi:hypothetical protein [Parvibacter caecicola]|uniref:hypothetical protein n=1 Tax=Parvibacter caecicola TaxID=747645 RepID=UPI002731CCBC|nr:hypothetical protein [Parvibacter caecicola]